MRVIAFDTETFYSKDVTVQTVGPWKYARDPRANCYMLSVSDGTETWAGEPKDFNFNSLNGAVLLSHNAAFDQEIYFANLEAGRWPKIDFLDWHCTANMTAYLCNRRSLADAAEFLLDVKVSKVMRNYMKGKTWADAIAEGKDRDLLKYAEDDAILCYRLFAEHGHKWPDFERRLSKLTIEQGRRGVHIHQDRLNEAISNMQQVRAAARETLPWVAAGRPDASPIAMAEECRKVGIPPMPVKAHDAEGAVEWEDTYAPRLPWVKGIKDLRRAKKALATLETMQARMRDDGTMPFTLKYFGAHTGRWSGDGGLNFQNFSRLPLFIDEQWRIIDDPALISELAEQHEKNPDELSVKAVDMRGLIIAPPQKMLAAADLSQIEPRVLNVLCGNHKLLSRIREGFPIYEAHARDSMGWTGGSLKKENKGLYSLAKARVLGLGYGCGWNKFITVAQMMGGIDITVGDREAALRASVDGIIYDTDAEGKPCEPFIHATNYRGELTKETVHGAASREIVRDFRQTNPLITAFWRQMDEALAEAANRGDDLTVELPSGRSLTYRKVRRERRTFTDPNDPTKKVAREVFTAEADSIRRAYYGGLIVENIVQAVARDVFAHNMMLIEEAGHTVLWSVHDEAVCAINSEHEAEDVRRIMATTPAWISACPIDAEVSISDRYKK
jgi:hypothetical protein